MAAPSTGQSDPSHALQDPVSKAVLRELHHRRVLNDRILWHLSQCFDFSDEKGLTPREVVYRTVCRRLVRTRSNDSCLLIRAALEQLGVLPVNHSGRLYYRGIRPLEATVTSPG